MLKKEWKELKELKKEWKEARKDQKIAKKQVNEVKVEPEVELVAELRSPNVGATRFQSAKRYSLPGPRIVSNLTNTSYMAITKPPAPYTPSRLTPRDLPDLTKATGHQTSLLRSLPTILPRLPTSLLKPGPLSSSSAVGTKVVSEASQGYMEVVGTKQSPMSSLIVPSSTLPGGKSGRAYFKLPNGKWEMATKPNQKWQAATKDPNYGLVGGTIQSLLSYTKLLTFVVQVVTV